LQKAFNQNQTGEGEVIAIALGTISSEELASVGGAEHPRLLHASELQIDLMEYIQAHATACCLRPFNPVGAKTLVLANIPWKML